MICAIPGEACVGDAVLPGVSLKLANHGPASAVAGGAALPAEPSASLDPELLRPPLEFPRCKRFSMAAWL